MCRICRKFRLLLLTSVIEPALNIPGQGSRSQSNSLAT